MRAILVDPFELTTTEIDPPDFTLDTMSALVGAPFLDRSFLGGKVCAYVDGEGLMRPGQRFWHFETSPVLMAGKCLLTSIDQYTGDTIPLAPYATLDITKRLVAFLGDANGAERAITRGIVERPVTAIHDMNGTGKPPKILWQWNPADCLDEPKEGGAA